MKKNTKTVNLLSFLFAWVFLFTFSGKIFPADEKPSNVKVSVKTLDKVYREWLELVEYIISPIEKDIFLKLTNNRDRDGFVDLFWKMRDPTKGTPENEFKDEHLKRFAYVNQYFSYGSPIPGWKTDRGKYYIILGPPVAIDEILQNGVNPTLIWDYYGDAKNGLPPMFHIVFYRKHQSDPYKLYVPIIDGPYALLRDQQTKTDSTDIEAVYKKLDEISPAVAAICLSLVPSERTFGYSPSMETPLMLNQIEELPKKSINTSYAQNFLNYKGIVETSVTTDYINVISDLYVFKDPILDLNFIHFALLPNKLSVDYAPDIDKYYLNYTLIVMLKKGDDVIFQYNRDFPLYYTKNELNTQLSNGIIVTDFFPVIEGNYNLIAVLQNSVSKEISYYEKKIVTSPASTHNPAISGPIVSYQSSPEDQMQMVYSAFNINGYKYIIDPTNVFGLRDTVFSYFWVERGNYSHKMTAKIDVMSLDEKRPYNKSYSFEIPELNKFDRFQIQLEKLIYGNYTIKTKLIGQDGAMLDAKERSFEVSPYSVVSHPPAVAKNIKQENKFLFYQMVATQYESILDISNAEFYYEKAYGLNSTHPDLLKSYATLLLRVKKYDKALPVIENLKGQPKEVFSYFSLKGKALYYLEKYEEALEALLSANKNYDSDIGVLNTLGLCLIRLNNKDEAIKALSASLKILDKQEDIQRILEQLRSEKK